MVAGLSGDPFQFNPQGDGPARYNIIHYKQISQGTFKWVNVGTFDDGNITLNMSGTSHKTPWFDCMS